MDKISILCVTQFIKRFNDTQNLFTLVQDVSSWLSGSVYILGELKTFNEVQKELMDLAEYIVTGKSLTIRSCGKLINSLKNMQKEMLDKSKIVVFTTIATNIKFSENVEKIIIDDEDTCIDTAYSMKDELKYLLYKNNENIGLELKNAVDIVITFEELLEASNDCFPLDVFSYDRMYLKAKMDKIEKMGSKILITGDLNATNGILEEKMPNLATNLAVNGLDLYYTLISVKEAINRSNDVEIIVIPLTYHMFFSDITKDKSDYSKNTFSKVIYPVYKKMHGFSKELLPVYTKEKEFPIYEAIIDLEAVRDVYHNALTYELKNMSYYNKINPRKKFGKLNYNFLEKNDDENFLLAKEYVSEHNKKFDLDRALYNQKLLDKFLDNMEELNKKIIFFVPPVTKFYSSGLLPDMINSYNQLVIPVIKSHKCVKFIDLFYSDKFDTKDFADYDNLNMNGAEKLTEIIVASIK